MTQERFEVCFVKTRAGWWRSEYPSLWFPGTNVSSEFRTLYEAATWTAANITHDRAERDGMPTTEPRER